MRQLVKLECPEVLRASGEAWLSAFLDDPTNQAKRFRYRHPEIKTRLKLETSGKCVYCESKIGHNTPGDVEHIGPVSKKREWIFVWENMTIACAECNRRKGNYFEPECMFISPYDDEVERMLIHLGPVVSWVPGNMRAEVSVRMLELNSRSRIDLVIRKIEKISEVYNLIGRINGERNLTLRKLLELQLDSLMSPESEFSAMVQSVVAANAREKTNT